MPAPLLRWTALLLALSMSNCAPEGPAPAKTPMPRQSGLVPLGPDPASNLLEFAVEGTGMVPERDTDSGQLPSYEVNEDPWLFPAVNITWEECTRALAEHGLTLPTEAQWEHACRRGWAETPPTPEPEEEPLTQASRLSRAYSDATRDLVDSTRRPGRHVGTVARGRASHLGLYDLPGNAWEWVLDVGGTPRSHVARDPIQVGTEGDLRVVRDWRVFWWEIDQARHVRRAALPCTRYRRLGFRAARAVTRN